MPMCGMVNIIVRSELRRKRDDSRVHEREPRGYPPLNTSSHIFVGIVAYDDGTKESFARSNVTVPVL